MNIYITLDYELFFGAKSGSVEDCIIAPTEALINMVSPYGIKFTCFVDSGYLLALEREKNNFDQLHEDYKKVTAQIKWLSENGHGIELHVHPHWEDTIYDGEKWVFDTSRYKLSDFSEDEVQQLIDRYTMVLKTITGKAPVAYRAGGWSAQPFNHIKEALANQNIFIDCTAFPQGYYKSPNQDFDFTNVQQYKTSYRFSDDLTVEEESGKFVEIPISSFRLLPFFYWRFAVIKLGKRAKHTAFGDGSAISLSKWGLIKLLTSCTHSVVSIDGYKTYFLSKAFEKYKKHTNNSGNFVLIGHPKAFTPYSLENVKEFILRTHQDHTYKIFQ